MESISIPVMMERESISSGMRPMKWPRPKAGSRIRPRSNPNRFRASLRFDELGVGKKFGLGDLEHSREMENVRIRNTLSARFDVGDGLAADGQSIKLKVSGEVLLGPVELATEFYNILANEIARLHGALQN